LVLLAVAFAFFQYRTFQYFDIFFYIYAFPGELLFPPFELFNCLLLFKSFLLNMLYHFLDCSRNLLLLISFNFQWTPYFGSDPGVSESHVHFEEMDIL